MDIPISQIKPIYHPRHPSTSTSNTLIQTLTLHPHPEGGYFTETDRNPHKIHPSNQTQTTETTSTTADELSLRAASSTIFYLLTPTAPLGGFHRHHGRTVHTLHRGRGRYVIIHADEATCSHEGSEEFDQDKGKTKAKAKARLESFVVGPDVARGERLQWVVGAGKYKASYLLQDRDMSNGNLERGGGEGEGLLISEVGLFVLWFISFYGFVKILLSILIYFV
jgi:predicted cupin superfamily sugar epimerase